MLIQPGKSTQNAYIESFNGRFRDECLYEHRFVTLEQARAQIGEWRHDYNEVRPHSSLQGRTPAEFAATIRADGTIPTQPTSDKLATRDSTK